ESRTVSILRATPLWSRIQTRTGVKAPTSAAARSQTTPSASPEAGSPSGLNSTSPIASASPTTNAFNRSARRVLMGASPLIAAAGQTSQDPAGSRPSLRDQPIGARRAQPARVPGAIARQGLLPGSQAHRGLRSSSAAGGRP